MRALFIVIEPRLIRRVRIGSLPGDIKYGQQADTSPLLRGRLQFLHRRFRRGYRLRLRNLDAFDFEMGEICAGDR